MDLAGQVPSEQLFWAAGPRCAAPIHVAAYLPVLAPIILVMSPTRVRERSGVLTPDVAITEIEVEWVAGGYPSAAFSRLIDRE